MKTLVGTFVLLLWIGMGLGSAVGLCVQNGEPQCYIKWPIYVGAIISGPALWPSLVMQKLSQPPSMCKEKENRNEKN